MRRHPHGYAYTRYQQDITAHNPYILRGGANYAAWNDSKQHRVRVIPTDMEVAEVVRTLRLFGSATILTPRAKAIRRPALAFCHHGELDVNAWENVWLRWYSEKKLTNWLLADMKQRLQEVFPDIVFDDFITATLPLKPRM